MVDHREIRQVLRSQFITASGLPVAARRSWEGRGFSPPDPPATWVREKYMPTSDRLVATNQLEVRGIIQYDVCVPANSGTEDAEDLAKAIGDVFKPTTSLVGTAAVVEIAIDKCERLSGTDDGVWYYIPIQIHWRAYATIS